MSAPVKYGLFYFAVTTALMFLQYFISKDLLFNTSLALVSSFGFAILFIYLAIRGDRADESGYSLGDGIKAGMICYGIGSFLSIIAAYLLYNVIDPSLIDTGIEYARGIAEKTAETIGKIGGMDEATKAEMMAEMAKQEIPNPFTMVKLGINWVIGLIFPGIIIALITAAIMKRD